MREVASEHCVAMRSDPLRLREARRWLARLVREEGFDPQHVHDLAVAFSEACANVHRHACAGSRDGRIDLRVTIGDDRIVVTLDHDGKPFDPTRYTPPDLRRPSESGYGIYLIASLVDEVSFVESGTGGRVVLVKRRRPEDIRD